MIEKEARFPTMRNVFFVVFVTFFLYVIIESIWGGFQSKVKILILESLTILPALIYIKIKKFSFSEVFRLRKVDGNILLASVFIGLGLSVVTDELDRLIQKLVPMPEKILKAMEEFLIFRSASDLFILVLAVVIVAGFTEEMLFRGMFQGVVERSIEITKAVLITAFVFAFLHFNPWWFIEILIIGVLLGVLAWRCNSIFPGVVVHIINNGIAIIFINTDPSKLNWYLIKDHVSPIWIVIGTVLIIGGFRIIYGLTEREETG